MQAPKGPKPVDPYYLTQAKAYAKFTTEKNLSLTKKDAQKRIQSSLKFST